MLLIEIFKLIVRLQKTPYLLDNWVFFIVFKTMLEQTVLNTLNLLLSYVKTLFHFTCPDFRSLNDFVQFDFFRYVNVQKFQHLLH